ncbi:invasion associated locus B family protein [Haematospirillum sp. H1815]|uniref:invasion associated locus B family protein n=1 Tax=Haematospirillum sp. H1815 TaxID=2723108 RepID=UPI001ADE467F|nr:invasion associated locus B family protein [Haematospirillum sp. H1815]
MFLRLVLSCTLLFPVLTLLRLLIQPVQAAETGELQRLGTYGEWTAYTATEKGKKLCYMASQPLKAEGDYINRGDIFALITHRPAQNALDVFQIVAGYTYKDGSSVELKIGKKTFSLFTSGGRAWAHDSKTDTTISTQIRKGNEMVIRGTSSRGTLTTDTYSLSGATQAWEAISEACGVKNG